MVKIILIIFCLLFFSCFRTLTIKVDCYSDPIDCARMIKTENEYVRYEIIKYDTSFNKVTIKFWKW
jgi:hypothetical protein